MARIHAQPPQIAEKLIQRLSVYRRLLSSLVADGLDNVYSHELAARCGFTPAQVRRDLMNIGYSGSPTRGYNVAGLIEHIGRMLDADEPQNIAIFGVGHFGQALMAYFDGRRPGLSITAAFDVDPAKVGRVIHGCRCHPLDRFAEIAARDNIEVAILAVPAHEAQRVATLAVGAGVRAVLNFAPTRLRLPSTVYVENVDLTVCLEKVAYFARQNRSQRELVK